MAAMAAAAAAAGTSSGSKKKKKKKKSESGGKDYFSVVEGRASDMKDLERTKVSDLKVINVLGVGTFSRVSLVKHKNTGKTYALKRMDITTIEKLKQKTHIMNEKSILQEMDHPFVIKLHATFKDHVSLYMLTELVLGGELFSVLTRKEYLMEHETSFYVGCIVLALEALHSKNNIYRDLKPENILLDAQGYVKVCDFGFAKKLPGRNALTGTTCGTPEYVSPEMLQSKDGHGKPTDWWCVGILIYECIYATTPFAAADYAETYEMIQRYATGRMKINYTESGVTVTKPCKHLMAGLLEPEPNQRLGPTDIKKHEWFKGMDWDALTQKKLTPPWIPTVKNAEDCSNFESDEYGPDVPGKPYQGDPEWFSEF